MPLLVTGSIGIDTVKTPFGNKKDCLGGSSVYFSMAASFFAPVRFVGVIGGDCPFELETIFAGRDVDLGGLEKRPNSKTFRWTGTYHENMNMRTTDELHLNVLTEAPPAVPEKFHDSRFVFLANTHPALQQQLLTPLSQPQFIVADTMNCWIIENRDDLDKLLSKIHCIILNDDEAKLLADDHNLISAGHKILQMGPEYVVIKKGENGSLMFDAHGEIFALPAFPAADVVDPTGAGDSFAGGFMGYLAAQDKIDFETMKKAVAYGTVMASFTISDFSLDGLTAATTEDIEQRLDALRKTITF